MSTLFAMQANPKDHVATVFSAGATAGSTVTVQDPSGNRREVTLLGDIPYGHKVALTPIHAGDSVLKFGEEIGIASHDIPVGAHVHVHNLDSNRARGDLK